MKYDMTGGATVIGAMRAIAQLKPSIPVLGVAPCTENLPSGKATKPGDVVRAMTGKTIEVINTDAEGRLILADAIAYAKKLGATRVVDLATLTGAVSIALGDVHAAILGTDQELIDEVIAAGRRLAKSSGSCRSTRNTPNRSSRTLRTSRTSVAAKQERLPPPHFSRSLPTDLSWAHLDIAGTAWGDDAKPYRSKGPTGIAVRTLINLVDRQTKA